MSYNTLFAQSNVHFGSASLNVEHTELDKDVEIGLAIQQQLDDLGVNEMHLAANAELVDTMLDLADEYQGTGTSKMVYAMLNHFSAGAIEDTIPEAGFSMESLSGMRDSLSRGYDMVIEFIEKMIREAKVFMTSFFDKFPGLRKNAKKLKDRVSDTSGTAEETKVKLPKSVVGALCDKDKKITNVVAGLEAINKLREDSGMDNTAKFAEGAVPDTFTGSPDDVKNATTKQMSDDNPYNETKWNVVGDSNLPNALKGLKVRGKKDLPGNKIAALSYRSDAKAQGVAFQLSFLASLKIDVYAISDKFNVEDGEHPVLSLSDIESICDRVETICDTYERSKDSIRDGIKTQEKMLSILKKIKGNVDKSDYKDVRPILNKAKSAYQNLARFATNPTAKISAYAYTTAGAALSYGDKSLSQYK